MRRRTWILIGVATVGVALVSATTYRSYTSLYDAQYVGSATCGSCHTQVYERWKSSPHAFMARKATPETVVGDFSGVEWSLPEAQRKTKDEQGAVARMFRQGDEFYMALLYPPKGGFVPFKIEYVIGYQYRQTYLYREPAGVLRKLPLEWSVARKEFFDYWAYQEAKPSSLIDFWHQMKAPNSAWNLFCARCHTTHLEVRDKDAQHTRADTHWSEDGIACEACHGPGSAHVDYFRGNYVNRVAAFANSKLRGQPVAFIANAPKLTKGQDLSICARCHGPDIQMQTTDVYRDYEPGYSKAGKINDLSPWFKEMPLQPGRKVPTVECWDDGRPKGIAMLFRSFLESKCYERGEVRCYDCHDPHANKLPAREGLLTPSAQSDAYCMRCHQTLAKDHSRHAPGTPGSFCYDCHMPRHILNLASGTLRWTRSHTFSEIPSVEPTRKHGMKGAPNACSGCHTDRDVEWVGVQLGLRK